MSDQSRPDDRVERMEFLLGLRDPALIRPFRRQQQVYDELCATLAAPSLWDDVVALLARQGHDLPADLLGRDVTVEHRSHPLVEAAWVEIYGDDGPDNHLRLLGEALTEVAEQFDLEHVVTAFASPEVAIDPLALAALLRRRIADEPLIDVRARHRVESVKRDVDNRFEVAGTADDDEWEATFDQVVNALWGGRIAVDETLGCRTISTEPDSDRRPSGTRHDSLAEV